MKYLLTALSVLILLMTSSSQTIAQDSENCDAKAVGEWIVQRQAWRNATGEVQKMITEEQPSWDTLPSWLNEVSRHMQAIADLEHPECANEALIWTYYYYDAMERFWACGYLGDEACQNEMNSRLAVYHEQIDVTLEALSEVAGIPYEEYDTLYGDLLPEGWSWPPETLREIFPSTYTEGTLDFEGSGNMVSNPISVPEGIYRVSLETEGTSVTVEMVVLWGECYIGNATYDHTVFSSEGNSAQTLITSEECDVVWQVEADGSFKMTFEKVR